MDSTEQRFLEDEPGHFGVVLFFHFRYGAQYAMRLRGEADMCGFEGLGHLGGARLGQQFAHRTKQRPLAGATARIASNAHRINSQGLGVIPVVVFLGWCAAVHAGTRSQRHQAPILDRFGYLNASKGAFAGGCVPSEAAAIAEVRKPTYSRREHHITLEAAKSLEFHAAALGSRPRFGSGSALSLPAVRISYCAWRGPGIPSSFHPAMVDCARPIASPAAF